MERYSPNRKIIWRIFFVIAGLYIRNGKDYCQLYSFYVYPEGIENAKERNLNEIQVFTEFDTPRIERKSLFNQGVILFLAKDIESKFNEYFNNWLKFYNGYTDITQLFFSVHYNNQMYLTNRFLNVIQALESYHRARKGKTSGELPTGI